MNTSDYTTIPLSQGQFALIDSKYIDWVNQWKWHALKSRGTYYARRMERVNGKQCAIQLHREILAFKLGRSLQDHEKCDHIDGNGLNNLESNLRIANDAQNSQNRNLNSNNKSGFPGVFRNKGRGKAWRAGITANRKRVHVGYFDTPEEAHEARCKVAKELFGEFWRPD